MTPTYKKRKQAGVKGRHWETLLGIETAALSAVNPVSQRLGVYNGPHPLMDKRFFDDF